MRSPVGSQALFSLCLLCRSSGFSVGVRPVRGLAGRLSVSVKASLPALSRCAIPHEMVTTDRVAKSHNIIRSSRRVWCLWRRRIGPAGAPRPLFRFYSSNLSVRGGPDARQRSGPAHRVITRRRVDGGVRARDAATSEAEPHARWSEAEPR